MKIFRKQSLISVFPLLFLVTFLKASVAKADVLVPGEEFVDYCFKITNIDKYPDYLIVALVKSQNPSLPHSNQVVNKSECVGLNGYREYSEVYALKKSDVNVEDIIKSEYRKVEELKDFESKKAKLIPAKNKIYSVRSVPVFFQIESVICIYEITGINDKSLILVNKGRKNIYKNTLLIMPIIGMSLIGGVIYWKKSNKLKRNNDN
ncbi:MAG: hypothetical protein ACFB2X_17665 [Rivularia sp. (in: cyanobacteria)]